MSVCLSHAGILWTPLNISSVFLPSFVRNSFVKGVEVLLVQLMVDLLPMWMWTLMVDLLPMWMWTAPTRRGSHLLLSVFGWWWLRSRYCCSLLCGLGQVQKAVANPHFKAHLFQDTRQGVHSLCSVNYAPWQSDLGPKRLRSTTASQK